MTGSEPETLNRKGTTMTAKYHVGQKLQIPVWHSHLKQNIICDATIVNMYQPGGKRNSHMFILNVYPADGGLIELHHETADLTYMLRHVARKKAEATA
jgi:hypothetical protein